jgi:anthranilate synthase/aminodeoxychorismate synthase-like glutamine amidotransferase
MVLLIDNYDSFVHNLARYVALQGYPVRVVRNDAMSLADIAAWAPSHIILSPGPCTPNEAGICLAVVRHFIGRIPLLGVCLGHQVIAQAVGGRIAYAKHPLHGQATPITHHNTGIFAGLPPTFSVGRYHSLIVDTVPDCLEVTAISPEGEIMALAHKSMLVWGVQFHPESILTDYGHEMMENFLRVV